MRQPGYGARAERADLADRAGRRAGGRRDRAAARGHARDEPAPARSHQGLSAPYHGRIRMRKPIRRATALRALFAAPRYRHRAAASRTAAAARAGAGQSRRCVRAGRGKARGDLACPIVSVLDRWLADSVQPAAQRWFGARVVEIKQISAYSCRGMNGNAERAYFRARLRQRARYRRLHARRRPPHHA